ncbi:DUF3048 domain-containing protein [Salibacterium aidingense]|uniref:DUF3048 domain-containing protein n=1 Tax=Salibacterium aidingense TaxID=384933 RepID=UPI0003FE14B8|nr:DUF3048 domain-containing protein [Salibacterium aidingense]
MKKYALIGCSFCFLLGSACSPEENTEAPAEEDSADHEPVQAEPEEKTVENSSADREEPEEEEYDETEPLTGEGTDEVSPYRPVAVMINNHPKARPQTGINKADIVYEVLTEGDMTRFLAVYQSEQPEELGPVRSARDYFIDLAAGYDSLFVAHGWSPEAKQMLQSGAAPYLNGLFHDGTLFQRSSERQAPHNSYITFEDALQGLSSKGYEMEQDVSPNHFKEEGYSDSTASEAEDVSIWYRDKYVVKFSYDEEEEQYERSSDNTAAIDTATDEQTAVKNIFIVEAPHRVIDDKGRREIDLSSGGEGLLLQNGKALTVQWKKEEGRILPVKDGQDIPFAPGKTWINVIPSSSGIEGSVQGVE